MGILMPGRIPQSNSLITLLVETVNIHQKHSPYCQDPGNLEFFSKFTNYEPIISQTLEENQATPSYQDTIPDTLDSYPLSLVSTEPQTLPIWIYYLVAKFNLSLATKLDSVSIFLEFRHGPDNLPDHENLSLLSQSLSENSLKLELNSIFNTESYKIPNNSGQ